MSRLIDVDDIHFFWNGGRKNGKTVFAETFEKFFNEIIEKAPTVDAIPVEWMRQFKNAPVTDESAKRCDECGGDFVEWMILEWKERKENGQIR